MLLTFLNNIANAIVMFIIYHADYFDGMAQANVDCGLLRNFAARAGPHMKTALFDDASDKMRGNTPPNLQFFSLH